MSVVFSKKAVFGAVKWSAVATAMSFATQAVVLAVYARYVSKETFGELALANSILTFSSVVTQAGFKPLLVNDKALDREFVAGVFTLVAILSVFLAAILMIGIPALSDYFSMPQLCTAAPLIIAAIFLSNSFFVSETLLERDLEQKKLALTNSGTYLLGYGLPGIVMAVRGMELEGLLLATILQSILKLAVLVYLRPHPVFADVPFRLYRQLLKMSGGVNAAWICNYVALNADNWIVGKAFGPAALGQYFVAFQLMDMPRKFLAATIERLMLPIYANANNNEADRFKGKYILIQKAIFLLIFPVTMFICVMSRQIIEIYAGASWSAVGPLLGILVIQVPFRSLVRNADMALTVKNRLNEVAVTKLIYAVSMVLMCAVASFWGVEAVAVAVTVVVLLNLEMSGYLLKKAADIELRMIFSGTVIFVVNNFIAAGAVLAIQQFVFANVYVEACVATLIFIVTLAALTKLFDPKTMKYLNLVLSR